MKSTAFRGLLAAMIFIGFVIAVPGAAYAQDYPAKAIRYIVPFPPGGITDMMARTIGQKTSDAWKQAVVVDNRPGGNALIGADLVAKSAPDGYTWLAMTITHTVNVTLFPQAPYSFTKDLKAVSVLGSLPIVTRINAEVTSVLKQPDTAARVREQGFDIVANSAEAAQDFMAAEVARWGKLVREANIKAD